MPRATDDPTLSVPDASAEFRDANPEVFARAQGDPETTSRLAAIERRAEAIKERFRAHFDRNEELWVVREAIALTAKRTFPTLQHPRPNWAPPTDFRELMMGIARRNVNARAIQRMMAINTTKTRLQNAVLRNRPQQGPAPRPANDQQPKTTLKQKGP